MSPTEAPTTSAAPKKFTLGRYHERLEHHDGNGATVVLVIGNPIPPEQAERARGYTCAGGSQGIVLSGAKAHASKRIVPSSSRPQCLEWGGPDEQEYWLFGHD